MSNTQPTRICASVLAAGLSLFAFERICGARVWYVPPRGSEIHNAVAAGDLAKMNSLLAADPSYAQSQDAEDDATPLHWAARSCREEITQVLIAHGAEPNALSHSGRTPLHYAAQAKRHIDCVPLWPDQLEDRRRRDDACSSRIVTLLLASGARVNATDHNGVTPLHEAARAGYSCVVEVLLAASADPAAVETNHQETPLHWAAEAGHEQIVKMLLASGASVNAPDDKDRIPLHWAARAGHAAVTDILLKHGADVSARSWNATTRSKNGLVPFQVALAHGHKEVGQLILGRLTDIHATDARGMTLTHWAVEYPSVDALQMLLTRTPSLEAKDHLGRTALHIAAEMGRLEEAKLLLDARADVNATDNARRIPLHLAAQAGHEPMVRLLLRSGSRVNATDESGMTPLERAIEGRVKAPARILLLYSLKVYWWHALVVLLLGVILLKILRHPRRQRARLAP